MFSRFFGRLSVLCLGAIYLLGLVTTFITFKDYDPLWQVIVLEVAGVIIGISRIPRLWPRKPAPGAKH